jgi:hypothetical protein
VGLKRKGSEKRVEWRVTEDVDDRPIAHIRWGYGAGGSDGKGVEKNKQRDLSTGGRSQKIDGGSRGVG